MSMNEESVRLFLHFWACVFLFLLSAWAFTLSAPCMVVILGVVWGWNVWHVLTMGLTA